MELRLSISRFLILTLLTLGYAGLVVANVQSVYSPSKVIYDFSDPNPEVLGHMLDRANLLQKIYQDDIFEASIVFVIHEDAIPLFVKEPKRSYSDLMIRAKSLVQGEIIQFRLCEASASMQGFKQQDFHDFVSIVPMADAEIVKLQQQGYAYLR